MKAPEILINHPLFDFISANLERTGNYATELSAEEIKKLIDAITQQLLSMFKQYATVSKYSVETTIAPQKALDNAVGGIIKISVELNTIVGSASPRIVCNLINDPSNEWKLKWYEKPAVNPNTSPTVSVALSGKGVNIRQEIERYFADPNSLLYGAILSQMKLRGIEIKGFGLNLTPNSKLKIALSGSKVAK